MQRDVGVAGADPVTAVVEHGDAGRGGDLAGLLVSEFAGRVVGCDVGEAQSLHQAAGGDADDVGGGQTLAAAPGDGVDCAEMGMDLLQPFAVEEAAGLDGLVERREHDVGLCEQAVDQVPGAGRVEVEGEAAFAGVVEQVAEAAFDVGSIVEARAVDSQGVARGGLDADHVGAEVGEPARAQGEALVAEVDDDGTGEGEVGARHQSRLGS